MLNFNRDFTYLNLQCPECHSVSSEDKPVTEEIEVDVDDDTERVVLVCGQCGFGFYKE